MSLLVWKLPRFYAHPLGFNDPQTKFLNGKIEKIFNICVQNNHAYRDSVCVCVFVTENTQ